MNPYESLCYFDKRNPNGDPLPDDDDPREPRELGCACDNCFYGRDAMALEIIQLRSALESVREELSGCLERDAKAFMSMTLEQAEAWGIARHNQSHGYCLDQIRDALSA